MPHGRLTPLGRQLRSVLARISPTRTRDNTPITPQWHVLHPSSAGLRQSRLQCRKLHHGSPGRAASLAVQQEIEADAHDADHTNDDRFASPDDSANATRTLFRLNSGREGGSTTRERDANALQRILRNYVAHSKEEPDPLAADWERCYKPTQAELRLLRDTGYDMYNLAAWADIESEPDSFAAARKLEILSTSRPTTPPPLFVYAGLVNRAYVSASALRILIPLSNTLFHNYFRMSQEHGVHDDAFFSAVVELLRHAREVWPQSLCTFIELVLDHYGKMDLDEDTQPKVTRLMNKLLKHVSVSTAEHPFKDNHHQEAAMVLVLRFMAEHEPSLQINRDGYRAVIRVQLAQRKTSHDRLWAELKSLAWPPWKVDRTAMDELVDIENYGTSKAAHTLARMREAGYAPQNWECIAQVYAGWDIDGTPTIQTRTRHDTAVARHVWSARIETTRTVQEAWACYLAWEDQRLPHDQLVYLATVQKLREEDRRTHLKAVNDESQRAWPVFPGDAREIAPPPPSTHLWTYTRTKPPSVHDFYRHIRDRGAVLERHCLAFFVSFADKPESGLQYLQDHNALYPEIHSLLTLQRSHDVTKIPESIYRGAVTLFSRMGYIPSSGVKLGDSHLSSDLTGPDLVANYDLGIVRAMALLRLHPNPHRAWYHIVLQGLTREDNLKQMARFKSRGSKEQFDSTDELQQCHGAINAYQLTLRVLDWQRKDHVDPDSGTFYSFCRAVENFVVACWVAVQNEQLIGNLRHHQYQPLRELLKASSEQKHHMSPEVGCRDEFMRLVSPVEGSDRPASHLAGLPRLLTVPSPYALHAYVRALGWLAHYDGLLELTLWMKEYRHELAERKDQDRGGEQVMRRTIVALRVFLERSWLDLSPKIPSRPNIKPSTYTPLAPGDKVDQLPVTTAPTAAAKSDRSKTSDDQRTPSSPGDGASTAKSSAPTIKIRREVSQDDRAWRLLKRFRTPAKEELIAAVRKIIDSVDEWNGWPDDDEVEIYCKDRKFGPKPFQKQQ